MLVFKIYCFCHNNLIIDKQFSAKGWDLKLAIHDYLTLKGDGNCDRPILLKCDSIDVTDSCKLKF